MLYYPGNVAYIFLAFSAFHFNPVLCRGGHGGGIGSSIGDSASSLHLSPNMTAVFAITVVISIITLYQLICTAGRFKKRDLPWDEFPSGRPYDIGPLFLKFLFCYLLVYLASNILYAICVAFGEVNLVWVLYPGALNVAVAFTGQFAYILLFAMLLSITGHRQRIQLNLYPKTFNLKFFFEAFLLIDILIVGIAQEVIGSHANLIILHDPLVQEALAEKKFSEALDAETITVAFQALVFLASVYTTIYAIVTHARLSRANAPDSIVWTVAFLAGPATLIITLYRLITVSISYAELSFHFLGLFRSPTGFFHKEGLLIADSTIGGVAFIFVAECCLHMGAPPRPQKTLSA